MEHFLVLHVGMKYFRAKDPILKLSISESNISSDRKYVGALLCGGIFTVLASILNPNISESYLSRGSASTGCRLSSGDV